MSFSANFVWESEDDAMIHVKHEEVARNCMVSVSRETIVGRSLAR